MRRAVRIGGLALVVVLAAGYLYLAVLYRSLNVFAPPDRISSLGRTYLLGGSPPMSLDDIAGRRSPGHNRMYTLERVGTLPPGHDVYQWQNDQIRGQATTSAFLEWGGKYVTYSLSGGA
ncbi:hypothetical protein [Prescottella subtropica]|uniref:hypothetical protein n=1 Tax=Prescottella subtropica TaxID=2545757 RepID=UPI0010F85987|nr:hypothetical protein [Prescottella subtropica]